MDRQAHPGTEGFATARQVAAVALVGALVLTCVAPASATTLTQSYAAPDGSELGLVFDEGTGLSAQVILTLNRPDTVDILLTNTSSAIPSDPNFDSPSDQTLTSLYLDFGGPGETSGDAMIVGGGAWVAEGSTGVGKHNTFEEGDDISHLWGYGTHTYDTSEGFPEMGPNIVSTNRAHMTAFASGGKLPGPDYGAISSANLVGGHSSGLSTISDTIQLRILLDQNVGDLWSLVATANRKPYVEFGSDHEFFVQDDPPVVVPEPVTLAGFLCGAGFLLGYVRRRRPSKPGGGAEGLPQHKR